MPVPGSIARAATALGGIPVPRAAKLWPPSTLTKTPPLAPVARSAAAPAYTVAGFAGSTRIDATGKPPALARDQVLAPSVLRQTPVAPARKMGDPDGSNATPASPPHAV